MKPANTFAKLLIFPDLMNIKVFASALKLTEEELIQLEKVVTEARNLPETISITEKIEYLTNEIEHWIEGDKKLSKILDPLSLHQRVKTFSERLDTTTLIHDALNISESIQFFKDILFICINNSEMLQEFEWSKIVDASKKLGTRSGGSLINIMQHTILSSTKQFTKSCIGAGLFAGWAALKELSFEETKQIKDEEFQRVTTEAEENCLTLLRMYKTVEDYYENLLKQKPEKARDEAFIKERSNIRHFLVEQIKTLQNDIASLGAANQEHHSKRRLNRYSDLMNIAFSFAPITGAPGVIGCVLIKTLTSIGELTAGVNLINSNAMFNHGVTQEKPIAVISDQESVSQALNTINASYGTTVAITGPIIKINKSTEAADGRVSCAFVFTDKLPKIKAAPGGLDKHSMGKRIDLRTYLEDLILIQDNINIELSLLKAQYQKLISNKTSWPCVSNIEQLIENLKQKNAEINQQVKNMGASVMCVEDIREIASNANAITEKLDAFQSYVEIKQKINPFDQLFKNGELDQTVLSRDDFIFDNAAKKRLCDDINFTLTAMNSMIDYCSKISGGKHIANRSEIVSELESKVMVLKHFSRTNPDPIAQEEENKIIKGLEDGIKKISNTTTLAITVPVIRINESLEAANGRISCTFLFGNSLPEIPKLPNRFSEEKLNSHLDTLISAQERLREEFDLLVASYQKLRNNKESFPSVTNIEQLIDNLRQKSLEIQHQIDTIGDQTMLAQKRLKISSKSISLNDNLDDFKKLVKIKQSYNPFDQLFKNGVLDKTELLNADFIIDNETKQRLREDINFSLKTISSMIDGDEDAAKIKELISEQKSKVFALKHVALLNTDPSEQNTENKKIKELEDDIDKLSHKLTEDRDAKEVRELDVIDFTRLSETDAIVMPDRNAFGILKDSDREKSVDMKLDVLLPNQLKNIQIKPLKIPTNRSLLAACKGDLANLASIIEGVKTEMQWIAKFMEESNGKVNILNIKNLMLYYSEQTKKLEEILHNPEKYLGRNVSLDNGVNSAKKESKQSKVIDTVKEKVSDGVNTAKEQFKELLNNPQEQLSRAYSALEKMHLQQNKTVPQEKEVQTAQAPTEESTTTYSTRNI